MVFELPRLSSDLTAFSQQLGSDADNVPVILWYIRWGSRFPMGWDNFEGGGEMPFGMLSQLDPMNHVLAGVQIPNEKGQFWGEGRADDTDVSCAKTAEPIKMLFGLWTRAEGSMY